MNDHVHPSDGVAGTGEFLPEELERARDFAVALLECELAFDEQARRAARVVVSFLALTRAHEIGDEPADFLRREKFSRTLSLSLGEFAQQILVRAPKEVGFDIVKAKPVTRVRQCFNHAAQSLIADFALTAASLIEIDDVDYAAQRRVCFHDRAHSRRELFAECVWFLIFGPIKLFASAYNRPTRWTRNVETNERMIGFQNFERGFLGPVGFC